MRQIERVGDREASLEVGTPQMDAFVEAIVELAEEIEERARRLVEENDADS